jgi:hypothetical protein
MRTRRRFVIGAGAILALAALTIGIVRQSGSSEQVTVADLAQRTHFHGLAVDPGDSARLLLATHHGLYAVRMDGSGERISQTTDDFMGFMPHPSDTAVLYASGHPAAGGNLGFIESRDGGRSWRQLSEGAAGVADFHNMAISPADPKRMYGAYAGTLQVSRDGGSTWAPIGSAPEGLLDLAASAASPDQLFAGTQFGLLRSTDGGKSWALAYSSENPVPLVQVSSQGTIFAFVVGTGLLRSQEADLAWLAIGAKLGDRYVVHLAVDPRNERKLYAITMDRATQAQEIFASGDAGVTWNPLGSTTTTTG